MISWNFLVERIFLPKSWNILHGFDKEGFPYFATNIWNFMF